MRNFDAGLGDLGCVVGDCDNGGWIRVLIEMLIGNFVGKFLFEIFFEITVI